MKIGIAGAGAGKTTSMANKIIEFQANTEEHMKIFCITFTNNAVKCIRNKLQEYYGEIPSNIILSTIHSFLYQEFIRPYYYLLYGKQYERVATGSLPENPVYKSGVISRLENRNILHQTVIPERAKWIIVKKSKDKKEINIKRKIILDKLKKYCGAIFIDEAQDIDNNMFEVIKSLNELEIPMILMGDPKQDLRGYKCFRKLADANFENVKYYNLCHRCPQKHLVLSNLIVEESEKQYSEKKSGAVIIYFESEKQINELINDKNFDLIYISKKQGIYETHGQEEDSDIQSALCEEIAIVMKKNHPNMSELELMKNSFHIAEKLLEVYERNGDKKQAMQLTFKGVLLKEAYGRIIGILPNRTNTDKIKKININSIDSIKGQEGNNCLFILTTDLATYLLGGRLDETIFKNKLYVALTRSLDKLTIYITLDVETKYNKNDIKRFFQNYNCVIKH